MQSLYIHIPFCRKKCLYCSFVVYVGQQKLIDRYIDCINIEAQRYKNERLKTIYIGGGTPSNLNFDQLKKLFKIIKNNFKYSNNIEYTVEINPEDVDGEKLKLFKAVNVNRISLGVQTFNNKYLKILGRNHDRSQSIKTFNNLRKAGFDNINVDLMYGFPNQSKKDFINDLSNLIKLKCDHVSLYSLTIEKNSRFYVQKVLTKNNHWLAEKYMMTINIFKNVGLKQYEVSNFSRRGKESKHNLNYWEGGNYIGLGVAAHSHKDGYRYWNVSNIRNYIKLIENKDNYSEGYEKLNNFERLIESIVFGLRINKGVNILEKEKIFNSKLSKDKSNIIKYFIDSKFLKMRGHCLIATDQGRIMLDEISSKII